LDVCPATEQALFMEYGRRFGWFMVDEHYNKQSDLSLITSQIVVKFINTDVCKSLPPA